MTGNYRVDLMRKVRDAFDDIAEDLTKIYNMGMNSDPEDYSREQILEDLSNFIETRLL